MDGCGWCIGLAQALSMEWTFRLQVVIGRLLPPSVYL